jgi:thiaminase/transcriptional activator TenA
MSDTLPGLTRGLFGRLRADAMTEWNAYVDHPFVRALAAGTLDPDAFRRYLVQDYLFILHYARAYALAIYKSDTPEEMRAAAEMVSGLLNTELSLHVAYCRSWDLDEATLLATPPSLELLAYTGFILDRAQTGDLLDLTVALCACLAGYGEIGTRLMADLNTKRDGNPYFPWIEMYAGEEYQHLVAAGLERLDIVAEARGAAARYPRLLADFRTTVWLEAAFWSGAERTPSR